MNLGIALVKILAIVVLALAAVVAATNDASWLGGSLGALALIGVLLLHEKRPATVQRPLTSDRYRPRAMAPGSTSREVTLLALDALLGWAAGSTFGHFFHPSNIEELQGVGAFSGAALVLLNGTYR